MNYPTMDQVEAADHKQLGTWSRFLPGPNSDEKVVILKRIMERFKEHGGWTPELSKAIGWNLK